jgi:hypothetical protein
VRRLLFATIVVFLLGSLALVLSGHRGAASESPPRPSPRAVISSSASSDGPPSLRPARVDARRFLAAFLAFEAGDQTPRTRRAVRATSGRRLAGQILAAPRTSAGARGPVAVGHLRALRLHRLPGDTGLLLASGTAIRPGGPEAFSFIFARRGGRWLAIAPGE